MSWVKTLTDKKNPWSFVLAGLFAFALFAVVDVSTSFRMPISGYAIALGFCLVGIGRVVKERRGGVLGHRTQQAGRENAPMRIWQNFAATVLLALLIGGTLYTYRQGAVIAAAMLLVGTVAASAFWLWAHFFAPSPWHHEEDSSGET
jgi:VanZ family protein